MRLTGNAAIGARCYTSGRTFSKHVSLVLPDTSDFAQASDLTPDHGRQNLRTVETEAEASESDLEADAPAHPAARLVRELKVNALIDSRPASLDGGCEGAVVAARRGRGMGPSDSAAQGPVVGAADIVLYHFRNRPGM